MTTANEKIFDEMAKHSLYIQKVSAAIRNNIISAVDATNGDVKKVIAANSEITQLRRTTKKYATAVQKLNRDIAKARRAGWIQAETESIDDFARLIEIEQRFIDKTIKESLPFEITTKTVPPSVNTNLLAYGNWKGATAEGWFRNWREKDLRRVTSTIVDGFAQNQTQGQIERTLFGTKKQKYRDGVVNGTRIDAERLSRTIVNGITNDAKMEYYARNADILKGLMYDAIFDGRTTPYCIDRGGKVYPMDKLEPINVHYMCRSQYVPVVDGVGVLGSKPTVGGVNFRQSAKESYIARQRKRGLSSKKAAKKWSNLSSGYKEQLALEKRRAYGKKVVGSVPAKTTGEAWFRKQSAKFQDQILGKDVGKLYRKKRLSMSDVLRENSTRPMKISELERLYG